MDGPRRGRNARSGKPIDRRSHLPNRPRPRRRYRPRRVRRPHRVGRPMVAHDRAGAGAHLGQDRHIGLGARRHVGAAGSDGCWQALEASPRRRRGTGALHGILRWRGGQAAWHDHSLSRRLHRLHFARAAWRHGAHHPVELPDADHRALGRRGLGHGQRRRSETRRGGVFDGAGLRRSCPPSGPAGRRVERGAGPGRGGGRGTGGA